MKGNVGVLSGHDVPGTGGFTTTLVKAASEIRDSKSRPVKIHECAEGILLRLAVPEYKEEDLEVYFENEMLQITGWHFVPSRNPSFEILFSNGRVTDGFRKTFRFLETIRKDAVRTRFEDGILLIWLPKVEQNG